MKSSQKIFSVLAFTCLAVGLTACGPKTTNPIKDYDNLHGQPPYSRNDEDKTMAVPLVSITNQDPQLRFVQGETNEYAFDVNLFFSHPDEVAYNLIVTDGPTRLGAKLIRASNNKWLLRWSPSSKILGPDESLKGYRFEVQFVLTDASSPSVKREMRGLQFKRNFNLTLEKDSSRPIIEENIEITPGKELNPNQEAKIRFVVAAKGADVAETVAVNFISGPQAPTNELVQMDAKVGFTSDARLSKVLGTDSKTGMTRMQYEINFSAREFADRLLEKIDVNGVLKNKFAAGKIPSGEALFYIEAYNPYNHGSSIKRTVQFNVNLTDKAVAASYASNAGIEVKAGAQASDQFYIRTSDGHSILNVTSLQLGEQTIDLKNGKAEFNIEGTEGTLNCQAGEENLRKTFGCENGKCFRSCNMTVSTDCKTSKSLTLKVNTQSQLGADSQLKPLNYPITIKGQAKSCAGVAL